MVPASLLNVAAAIDGDRGSEFHPDSSIAGSRLHCNPVRLRTSDATSVRLVRIEGFMQLLGTTYRATIVLIAVSAAGCATSEIIPMGTDTYMISQTSAGGMFTNMGSLKAEVIKRANAFAESKGKVAIPLASHTTPPAPGQMPNFEISFN